jgi:transposase InsO family protein
MTGAEIAECLEMALSTVSGILTRIGLGKLSRLEPPEPPNRYERKRPGELIHIDVKKLGRIRGGAGHRAHGNRRLSPRGGGWEFVHVCVDDATRLAYTEVLADEKATTAIGFLRRAVGFYRDYGIAVERVMTDNGSCYRSSVHAIACRAMRIRHIRTRPYRPRTNGKNRALHPHHARRLGLRRPLRLRDRAHRGPEWLARLLQSPAKTRLPRPPATDRAAYRAPSEQRDRVLQLAYAGEDLEALRDDPPLPPSRGEE